MAIITLSNRYLSTWYSETTAAVYVSLEFPTVSFIALFKLVSTRRQTEWNLLFFFHIRISKSEDCTSDMKRRISEKITQSHDIADRIGLESSV
jgi:hypothetical protein